MATTSPHFIVILCGGTGPRLWPLSRADKPKPFLQLFSENSLLKNTFVRAQKIVDSDHIYIITNHQYVELVKKDLAGLVVPANIIAEPDKKNTAMAITVAAKIIAQKYPNAVITTFTADHFIGNLKLFVKNINSAVKLAADSGSIITIGIHPTSPSTSFGYILADRYNHSFYPVRNFIEKPPLSTAVKLLKSSHSFWNSGLYTFSISTLESELKHHAPTYFDIFQKLDSSNFATFYSNCPDLSFDVAISEKSKNLKMIAADFAWNDVGEWKSLYLQNSQTGHDNLTLNSDTNFIAIDSEKCLVAGQPHKIIGLVEVDNLAIIDTPDALLICNIAQNGSYKVRDLITKITSGKNADFFLKSYVSKNK